MVVDNAQLNLSFLLCQTPVSRRRLPWSPLVFQQPIYSLTGTYNEKNSYIQLNVYLMWRPFLFSSYGNSHYPSADAGMWVHIRLWSSVIHLPHIISRARTGLQNSYAKFFLGGGRLHMHLPLPCRSDGDRVMARCQPVKLVPGGFRSEQLVTLRIQLGYVQCMHLYKHPV